MLARRLTIGACRGGSTRLPYLGGVPPSLSTHSSAALLHREQGTSAAYNATARAAAAATTGGGASASAPAAAASAAATSAVFDAASVQLRGSTNPRFGYEPLKLRRILNEDEALRNDLAYCLSFAVDDSDLTRNLPLLFTDSRMREQLEISRNQLRRSQDSGAVRRRRRSGADDAPLPRTVQDALRPSRRAIVITETTAPFRVVDVNLAWEQLCGYTFLESKGKTLGSLLKGPETDQLAATSLISKLLQGEEAGATLTNYAKDGRMFRNRLRAGPLYEDEGDPSTLKYFVGVLQEVQVG